jgi:phosphatidylserine/phosphatidylglycerophosphate/cardiolipin synthase-like enzyme
MTSDLINDLQHLVETAPKELIDRICIAFEGATSWNQLQAGMLPLIHSADARELFTRIKNAADTQKRSPGELALALRAACAVEARHREAPQLELVWSGPIFQPYRVRRTDEVLLALIEQSKFSLTLVSFALYRMDRLSRALTDAVNRGVAIRMFMEVDKRNTPDLRDLYGDFLAASMHFYAWSKVHRLRTNQGGQGVLHAKAMIADNHQILVSSANLTEYAMSINIELGLLVTGGELPARVERIFDDYVERGVFVQHT